MSDVVERFLRYAEIASMSDPDNEAQTPSTPTQFDVAEVVANDLVDVGARDVRVDEHAYVTAHWPASPGLEGLPCLGFLAHLDTAWQAEDNPVHPRIVRYEGGDLVMGVVDGRVVKTSPAENPTLANYVGEEIVCTDGTSLLGGDDKAGVAEIITMLGRLAHDPSLLHPRIAVAFVPDEEIGHGADLLNLDAWGATWAFTVDGGYIGECSYETFNAAEAKLEARGEAVHPGYAKGLMVNAAEAIMKVNALLPAEERPEYTEGREGYYYLDRMEGSCEKASATYIIRDFDREGFEARKRTLEEAVAKVNGELGCECIRIHMRDQYYNMREGIEPHRHLIENACLAFEACGIEPYSEPVRGGTDGGHLTLRGLPCPNLSGGSMNPHGPKEYVPVRDLEAMVDVLVDLVGRYARAQGLAEGTEGEEPASQAA